MKIKKLLTIFLTIFIFSNSLFSQIYSSNQLIPASSWVYDALFMLNNETQRTSFATNAPLTAAEIKMYLKLVPYEKLSDSGKSLYDQLNDYLNYKSFKFDMGPAFFAFNLDLYPELLAKSNKNIDWTFATDYTGHKNSVDDYEISDRSNMQTRTHNNHDVKSYAASSNYLSSSASEAIITIPLYLGWSDYFLIQTDPCFAKSIWAMSDENNFTNLVYNFNDMDFLWPRNAYGSAGAHFEKWGVNINYARQGLQIGKTQTGSVIYNSTFETEGYFQLNLYCPRMKYNLDIVEVSTDKYIYLHTVEARPLFDWIRLGIVEATLVNKPFEMKFINPIMVMHSYGSWADNDYYTQAEEAYYGEAHICQYMGIQVELTPFKYSRLYFLYAQNEIQPANELGSASGKSLPDSFGVQLGYELTLPDKNKGWWTATLEGVYTTPFCYIKQGADWSLYSERYNMQSNCHNPVCSWIGTPFGPDALGLQTRLSYTKMRKWNAELDYLFVAHGTNSFGLFNNIYVDSDGQSYYAYYPSVLRKMGLISDQEAEDIARTYKFTGIVQYTNQITLKGSYAFNSHLAIDGQATYSFIFNNKNEKGDFAQGIEASFALEYKLFE